MSYLYSNCSTHINNNNNKELLQLWYNFPYKISVDTGDIFCIAIDSVNKHIQIYMCYAF